MIALSKPTHCLSHILKEATLNEGQKCNDVVTCLLWEMLESLFLHAFIAYTLRRTEMKQEICPLEIPLITARFLWFVFAISLFWFFSPKVFCRVELFQNIWYCFVLSVPSSCRYTCWQVITTQRPRSMTSNGLCLIVSSHSNLLVSWLQLL